MTNTELEALRRLLFPSGADLGYRVDK